MKLRDYLTEGKGFFIKAIMVNDKKVSLYKQTKSMKSKVDLYIDDKFVESYASQKIAQKKGTAKAKGEK